MCKKSSGRQSGLFVRAPRQTAATVIVSSIQGVVSAVYGDERPEVVRRCSEPSAGSLIPVAHYDTVEVPSPRGNHD